MGFIHAFEKVAEDVIDLNAWKASHPHRKLKRALNVGADKAKAAGRWGKSHLAVGLLGAGLGAGYGVAAYKTHLREKALSRLEAEEHIRGDKKRK